MTAFTSYVPAQVFPTAAVSMPAAASDAQQVQFLDERRYFPRDRRYDGRYDRRERYDRYDRREPLQQPPRLSLVPIV
jgi:hypothetical protein